MRIYLNNFRAVSEAIRQIKNAIAKNTYPVLIQINTTGAVAGGIALVKDFLGKNPLPFLGSREESKRWVCGFGAVTLLLTKAYLAPSINTLESLLKEDEEKCPLCKSSYKHLKNLSKQITDMLYKEINPPISTPVLSSSIEGCIRFNAVCLLCNHFPNVLFVLWFKNLVGEDNTCEVPSCILSSPEKSSIDTFCKGLYRIKRIKEFHDLVPDCYGGWATPPEYIDMAPIVEDLIKHGFLCKKHAKIIIEKLKLDINIDEIEQSYNIFYA